MSCFTSCEAGPNVLKKAQMIDKPIINKNCFHGKKNVKGIPVNTAYYKTIVYPTMQPMITPSKQLAITRMNAS